ncbi:MAG: dihydropteroate synthase, partial [Nitrospinota bacterium]
NQIEKGAAMLDICFIGSERGESTDMKAFLEQGLEKLDVPLMIDSLSYTVLEETLQQVCGKSVINSVNLLKGEKSIEGVAALALRYGAAIVAGTIDEKPKGGMALTGEQKVEVAARMFDLLSGKFGVHLSNIIIDPLVFPVISKGKRFIGAAKETIEGLRLIKKHLPGTSTLVGVSNISFGIPGRAGMVLSSVFLHHAQQTGLDFAIANPEKLLVYSSIGGRERELSEDLIFSGGDGPLKNFTSFYSGFGEKLRN